MRPQRRRIRHLRPPPPPHRPPAAGRRPHPRAPPPPPAPPRMPRQHRLDLARLDAEAAQLHLLIARPRNSSVPSARQRARSPVRYIRLPGAPNGSATNRSAVSPAGADSPAPAPRPRCKAPPPPPPAPGCQPAHPTHRPACWGSAGRSARSPVAAIGGIAPWQQPDRGLRRAIAIDELQPGDAAPARRRSSSPRQQPRRRAQVEQLCARDGLWARLATQLPGAHGTVIQRRHMSRAQEPAQILDGHCSPSWHHDQLRRVSSGRNSLEDCNVEAERRDCSSTIIRAQAVCILQLPAIRFRKPPCVDHHPFRRAGRAGGVDDVGGVVRVERGSAVRVGRAAAAMAGAVGIEADEPRRARAADRRSAGCVTTTGAPASASMKASRSCGIVGIERQIGAARLEDAEQPDHHLHRALDARPTTVSGPTPSPRR